MLVLTMLHHDVSDRRKLESVDNLTLTEDEKLCSICFEKPVLVTFGLLGISLILIDNLLLTP